MSLGGDHDLEEVADVDDSFEVIDIFLVDRTSGEGCFLEVFMEFFFGGVHVEGDDVDTWDHDIAGSESVHTENGLDEGGFIGGEFGFLDFFEEFISVFIVFGLFFRGFKDDFIEESFPGVRGRESGDGFGLFGR